MLRWIQLLEANLMIGSLEQLLDLLFAFNRTISILLVSSLPDNFTRDADNQALLHFLNLLLERFGEYIVFIDQ